MNLNKQYNKLKYMDGVKDRLNEFYSIKDVTSTYRKVLSYKIDGFIDAGLTANIVNKQELQDIIDGQHFEVFGITRQERRKQMKSKLETGPQNWDIYDTPAINRK
jgi:hypothetical protein